MIPFFFLGFNIFKEMLRVACKYLTQSSRKQTETKTNGADTDQVW